LERRALQHGVHEKVGGTEVRLLAALAFGVGSVDRKGRGVGPIREGTRALLGRLRLSTGKSPEGRDARPEQES